MTGAAAQAVERARLTVTEFADLGRAQHLQELSSALAAATTPGQVVRAAMESGLAALGAQSAVCRVPSRTQGDSLSCLAASGHPVVLTIGDVPSTTPFLVRHCAPCARRLVSKEGCISRSNDEANFDDHIAGELDPTPAVVDHAVTVVAEPLTGNAGPLGVLVFCYMSQHEPTDPNAASLPPWPG